MEKNKKVLSVLSTAAVAGLIVSAISTPASAKASAIDINTKDGKVYEYQYQALKDSAMAWSLNATGADAALYNHFQTNRASIAAYFDDVNNDYVGFDTLSTAILNGTVKDLATFQAFMENKTTPTTALTPSKVAADASGNVTVTPSDPTKVVTSVSAINLTTGASTVPTLPTTVKATLGDKTTVDAKITWSDAAKAAATYATAGATVTVNGTLADYGNYAVSATVTVNPAQLAVQSVTSLNAKQIQVVFNKAVDKTLAETEAKYVITNAAGSPVALVTDNAVTGVYGAVLQDDGKTVILNLNAAVTTTTTPTYLSVNINGITAKDDSSDYAPLTSQTIMVNDKTNADVSSVECKTNGTTASSVKVKFTEPVTAATFKIDGITTPGVIAADGMSATITSLSLDPSVNHTLNVVNLTDYNSNVAQSVSKAFSVTKDVSQATFTLSTEDDNKVVLTFDKEMDPTTVVNADITAGNISVKNELLTTAGITGTIVKYPGDTTNTKFLLQLGTDLYATKDSRTLTVLFADKAVKDSLGNKMDTTSKTVTLTKNTTKPQITGLSFVKDTAGVVTDLVFNFDKNIKPGTFANSNITVLDKNGVDVTSNWLAATSKTVNVEDKKVDFALGTGAANIKSGQYTIVVSADKFTDDTFAANKTAAYTGKVDFGAASSATFKFTDNLGYAIDDSSTKNTIDINYGTGFAMMAGDVSGSAVNPANYSLNGAALPAGTTVRFTSATKNDVKITLPDGTISKSDLAATLRITNVQDANGNTMEAYSKSVAVYDNTKPVLQSAKVINNNTIRLTYNEDMKTASADDVTDELTVLDAGVAESITNLTATSVTGYANQVDITTTDAPDVSAITKSTGMLTDTVATPVVTGYSKVVPTTYIVRAKTVTAAEAAPTTWEYSTDGGATWTTSTSALAYGVTFSFVGGTDAAGTQATVGDTWTFTVTPKFNTADTITIKTKNNATPANNALVDTSAITLTGNAQQADTTVTVTQ